MRRSGFTILEMLAVVLLTGIVLTAVVTFYINLSRANRAALELVRADRRTVAILDRVARDLEGAVLVMKPAELDPLAHPWLFLADSEGELGASRLKFASRSRLPRVSALRESDLEVVAYWLDEREDGSLDLVRWSHPHLPEGLDRAFPAPDDPAASVLAHGIAAFGVRLQSETGDLLGAWDSSQLVDTSQLPLAAEISLVLLPETDEGAPVEVDPLAADEKPFEVATRRVLLPLRPLDLAKQLDEDGAAQSEDEDEADEDEDGEEDDEDLAGDPDDTACMTVGQCVALNQAQFNALPAEAQAVIQSMSGLCFRDVGASLPVAVSGCR
jgi:type II secretory pathway component PulJ